MRKQKATPKKRGRPSERTAVRRQRIINARKLGLSWQACAKAGGLSHDTLERWREEDPEFTEDLANALAEFETAAIASIHRASRGHLAPRDNSGKKQGNDVPPDWKAAAWLLEKRMPAEYGRNSKVDVTSDGKPISGLFDVLAALPEGELDAHIATAEGRKASAHDAG